MNEDAFQSYGIIAQHRKMFPYLNAQLNTGLSADYSSVTYETELIDISRNEAGKYSSYTQTSLLLTNYDVKLLNIATFAQFGLTHWRNCTLWLPFVSTA